MTGSLRGRLIAATAAILAVVLAALLYVSTRITRLEFHRLLDVEKGAAAQAPVSAAGRALESRYSRTGSWEGADAEAAEAARVLGRQVVVMDRDGRPSVRSPGLAGVRISPRPHGLLFEWPQPGQERRIELRSDGLPLHDGSGREVGRLYVLPPEPSELIARDPAEPLNRALAASVVFAGIAAIALIAALARRLLRPIDALTRASRRLERGDLAARVEVPAGARDELAELARSFNAMAESVSKNEALRRALVEDVAHELRTPLTNVRAQLEAIQDGLAAPDRRVIDSLHEETLVLARLIDDLQDLALAEAGRLAIAVEPVDVREALERAAVAAGTRGARAGVRLEVDVSESIPPVAADRARLAQVLANLIDNSLTHTPAGGRIRLAARAPGHDGVVELSVSDDGRGIAPEHLPHVFERFYRADPSRARATGGTGLGLAIVRQLVRSQGGDVEARSAPGEGAAFLVRLPAAAVAPAAERHREVTTGS